MLGKLLDQLSSVTRGPATQSLDCHIQSMALSREGVVLDDEPEDSCPEPGGALAEARDLLISPAQRGQDLDHGLKPRDLFKQPQREIRDAALKRLLLRRELFGVIQFLDERDRQR